jgi:hypothetical protein
MWTMSAPARVTVAFFWLSIALAGFAVWHLVVGTSYGPYGGYEHVTLRPVCVLATSLLLTMTFAAWADSRSCAIGRRVWLVRGAMTALETPSRRLMCYILALQLGITFVMEQMEHVAATGRLCAGLDWLGLSPLLAIALQALVAVVTVTLLRSFLRGLVEGCDALLRLALAVCRAVLTRGEAATPGTSGSRLDLPFALWRLFIARHRALRGPPAILRIAN